MMIVMIVIIIIIIIIIIISEAPANVFWRRRQQVPPKRQYISTKVHGVTTVTLTRYSVYCDTIRIWFCGRSESVFGQIRYAGRVLIILSLLPLVRLAVNSSSCHWTRNPNYTVAIAHKAFM